MRERSIPEATVGRLPVYLRGLVEMAENGTPAGVMVNSPAIIAGRSGQGRVLCISPHPEQTEGLENIVHRAVQWVVEKE